MTAPVRPATQDVDPLEQLKALQRPTSSPAPDDDPLEQLKALQGSAPKRQALPQSFSPQSTAVAPGQASRRAEQARRPLLESVDLPFGLQHDLNAAAQGATFGTSDEAAAAVRALLGEKYSDAVADERNGLAQFRHEHGARSFIDEMIGGMASTGGVNGFSPAKTIAGRVAQSAATGAVAGAATGAGTAEGGIQERAKGAVKGAGAGAVFGGVVGTLGEGVRGLAGRGKETVDQIADRKLIGALGKDELSPDQAIDAAKQFSDDKPGVVLDIGGRNTMRLGRAVRTQPSTGSAQLENSLNARAAGTEERTINDLLNTTGLGQRENPFQKTEDLIATQKANAKPLYDKAYQGAPVAHPLIDEALQLPEFRQAYERGRRIARIDRVDIPSPFAVDEAAASGPAPRGTPKKLILTDAVRDETGALRKDLSTVPDHALEGEWQRLAELNAQEEALHASANEAHYRDDYTNLHGTEKTGIKGKNGKVTDVSGIGDGLEDADRIAADDKVIRDFRRSAIVRQARSKAMDRIQGELDTRVPPGDPTDFDFGANVAAKPAAKAVPAGNTPEGTAPVVAKEPRTYPIQGLDYMKRGLDDLIRPKMNTEGFGENEARALTGRLGEVRSAIDEVSPDYKAARGQFAGDERAKEAYALGQELYGKHPDALALELPKMSASEQELFRRGALEATGTRIESRATNRDPSKLANTTLDRKRLRLMFPDDASFSAFQKRLGEEVRMHQTRTNLQGGSQTTDKLAELADLADVPTDVLLKAATGNVGGAARSLLTSRVARELTARSQGITEARADALATRMQAGTGNRADLVAMLDRAKASVAAGDRVQASRAATVARGAQHAGAGAGEAGALRTPTPMIALPPTSARREETQPNPSPAASQFLARLGLLQQGQP